MDECQALEKLKKIYHHDLVDRLTHARVKSIEESLEILGLPVSEDLIQLCIERVEFLDGNLPRERIRGYRVRLPRMPMTRTPREKCASFWKELPDDVFCTNIEKANTFSEVMKLISAKPSRYNKDFFLSRVARLQIDVTRFPSMPPSAIPYEKLIEAIEKSTSYTGVVTYLDLPKSPGYRKDLEEHIRQARFDTGHFLMRWSSVTEEQMLEAFNHSQSVSGISKFLGFTPTGKIGGRTVKNYHKRLKELGLEHPGRKLGISFKTVKKIQREKQFHPSTFFTNPDDY